jgi:phytoene desaturase
VPKHFVVVGAGVGGLAIALRLAHRGHRVTVLEKTDAVGGRNRRVTVGNCRFDGGPSLMMMLDPFRRLYRDVGECMEDHLQLSLCDPTYRVYFGDGSHIDASPNMARMVAEIRRLSGPEDAAKYPGFLGRLADMYREAIPAFVERNYESVLDLARPRAIQLALRHGLLGSLAGKVKATFRDPRLQNLFMLQTMYLGLSPYAAPYVYAVLAFMEYGEGVWYPHGGLPRISESIAEQAQLRGAEIRLNTPVDRIEGRRVFFGGECLEADAIICNADLPYAEKSLLGRTTPKGRGYSCSAYVLYIEYEGRLEGMSHHTIALGKEFEANLTQIFDRFEIPEDPAFYVALSNRTEPEVAPPGFENLYLLVPSPNLTHAFSERDAGELQDRVFARLGQIGGFRRENIRNMRQVTPTDWAENLNLDRGAAFGLSHEFRQSVCFRPANRDRENPSLYYVGASTTPGNGLPMVLIGAELVEQRLRAEGRL